MVLETKSADLPKTFQADTVEPRWRSFWDERNLYRADPARPGQSYVIVIPPPNVTGVLHMGHGLPQTVQDLLIRFNRMRGRNTLWVPGTDHAGIATQSVVANRLRDQGTDPRTLTRDQFIAECWKWKEQSENTINAQVRSLGGSCDFSRYAFTMDATRARAVRVAFKHLYDRGLIYRGEYLVNWDPVSKTALSDDEVEYEDEQGFLYHINYPSEDGSWQGAVVATTRPETLFGDVAVAVHPSDERYKAAVGKRVRLPLTDRLIPVIADGFVKSEFGTGMVKITPAHDPNDFDCGNRLGLERINIFTDDARLNQHGGAFAGLDRFAAREKVLEALKAANLLVKVEKYANRVGRSYRSKAVIEPRLSEQWFVRMRPLAERAIKAVREGEIRVLPESYQGVYFHWMENVRDWCISRQLYWGHRIPIWYRRDDPTVIICHDGEGDPPQVAADPAAWTQDTDVLDTWFSSGLWPFSVMGWPADTDDFRRYFPTSVLVTGHDILFFWVARMIMMSYELTGQPPFRDVFLHGLIFGKCYYRRQGGDLIQIRGQEARQLDESPNLPKGVEFRWEKMSKSKGNVIDPLETGQKYGMDALRLTLAAYASQGRTIDLDRSRFESCRNFVNKLWNASRFVMMVTEGLTGEQLRLGPPEAGLRVEDRWILSQLARTIEAATDAIERYEFDHYVQLLWRFFWNTYCDWYIELVKHRAWGRDVDPAAPEAIAAKVVLVSVLEKCCRLLAPVTPFVTEEVWQILRARLFGTQPGDHIENATATAAFLTDGFGAVSLAATPWPRFNAAHVNPRAEDEMAFLQEAITSIRNIRGEMGVPLEMKVEVAIEHPDPARRSLLDAAAPQVAMLANVASLAVAESVRPPAFASTKVSGPMAIFVMLPESLRVAERTRLAKELEKIEKGIEGARRKLSLPEFTDKAPANVVAAERERLARYESDAEAIRTKLGALGC